ncbi:MAG: Uma2 family endonuclease [Armatimonadota bacterium]
MSTAVQTERKVFYPDSDGQPMADNTIQFECIVTIKGNLELLFADRPDVFVAGDLLWYPVEGNAEIRQAPDVMVAFGRPKGHRRSYKQWEEGNIPPQVVFEVWSPGNRLSQMLEKMDFYRRYGVEEYYIYYPDSGEWDGWLREGEQLVPVKGMEGWQSPRLGIRFEKGKDAEVGLFYPDGRKFLSFVELGQQAEAERQRADRLAAKLREMGIDPNQI